MPESPANTLEADDAAAPALTTELQRIAGLAARFLGVSTGAVSLLDARGAWRIVGSADAGRDAAGHMLARHVAAAGGPVAMNDPAGDPRFTGDWLLRDAPCRFYAGVPVLLPDGRCGGVLSVLGPVPRAPLAAAEAATLVELAGLAASALARQAEAAAVDALARRAELTGRALAAVGGAGGFQAAFQATLTLLCTHFGAAIGRIWRLDARENAMREVCHYASSDALEAYFARSNRLELSPGNSNVARAIETDRPQTVQMAELARAGGLPLVAEMMRYGMVCQVIQPVRHLDERLAVALMFNTERHDLEAVAADIASLLEVLHTAIYRKVAEERMRLLTTALDRASDAVLITEAAPLDEPGPRIVYANAAFSRATGYGLDEVLGRSPRLLQGPGTDRAAVAALGERLRRLQPARVELLNYAKDGTEYWVELDITPIAGSDGGNGGEAVTHFVSIQRDVTARRQAERAAIQAQKLQTIGQITGGVAHDFNNLLAIIAGNLELLEEALPGRNDLRQSLQAALRATDRGAVLTRSLLAFARQQPLEPRSVNVNEVVRDLGALLERTVPENIDVRLVTAAELWACEVDPSQLQNALLNLMVNARDAMPQGGRLTIETCNAILDESYAASHSEVAVGDYVMLAVSDTGTGMPPAVAARAFEPFFTTKPQDKGTGLGLAMVYGFMKQSRGHAAIYSEVGRGTTVRLYLPRFHGLATRAPRLPALHGAAPESATILVVEDNGDVRRLTCVLLRSLGYTVLEADTSAEALAAVQRHDEIDLLLTDIVLPGTMDGAILAREVLRLRPGMRVLYMSGYTENAILHHGRLDPGVLLLQKPFRRQELAAKVRTALEGGAP
ncbi:MAG: hypothetical protein BGP12_13930 [Rhodospirillales bacterium 70-18]|nr:response regulator [Rhodospirillales bacterium]OJY73677.1 MAG: hypothetical protein BGP12_13930 [Rhodospirillales bacterium 70-18]